MLGIIVNADDFGLNREVNLAVEEACKKRWITSTTIMANGDAVEDAVQISRRYPDVSFGVHLVLTEGVSLTQNVVLRRYGVIDKDGLFVRNRIRDLETIPEELELAVYNEWDKQIKKLLSLGLVPSHADSHHHIHRVLMRSFNKALLNNGILKFRNRHFQPFCHKPVFDDRNTPFFSRIKRSVLPQWLKYRFILYKDENRFVESQKKIGLTTTDYFMSCQEFVDLIPQQPRWGKGSTVELMCHPGHKSYKEEYELIKANKLLIGEANYISYHSI